MVAKLLVVWGQPPREFSRPLRTALAVVLGLAEILSYSFTCRFIFCSLSKSIQTAKTLTHELHPVHLVCHKFESSCLSSHMCGPTSKEATLMRKQLGGHGVARTSAVIFPSGPHWFGAMMCNSHMCENRVLFKNLET